MPLDYKNSKGEDFPDFEFFWNKDKKEWVIIFSTDVYSLNPWSGPVDASYAELDHAGMVIVGKDLEMLFTFTHSKETVSFLDGIVTRKEYEDIFSHPRLAIPLETFTSASKKIREITKEIGYPINWSGDENTQFYQHGGEAATDLLKQHLLIVDKNKDKKKKYWAYLKIAEESEKEIKKIFAELTQ